MKITTVEIHPAGSSNVIVLSLRDPARELPYNIKTIIGLDADEIVSRYYGVSGDQNTRFYDLTLEKREPILRIELNPDFSLNQTYSDLRDELYKIISSSRTGLLQLHFKNGFEDVAVLSGFVQKFEASLFTKTPEVQLTLKCPDPWLKAPLPVIMDISGFDPGSTNIVDNVSTAPHGFGFEMEFTGDVDILTINNQDSPGWSFAIAPVGGFLSGDVLHYSSELSERFLFYNRAGLIMHLADVVVPGSIWPILFPGNNYFTFSHADFLNWVQIAHYPTYWGV